MATREELLKQETMMGVVPMLKKDRIYSFWDIFLVTSSFSIATWCYTQGGYIAQFLNFKDLIINVFCVNILFIFITMLPVLYAVRYGIDLWIWLRAVLGIRGVAILAAVISYANFGWYAVCANLFATSLIHLIRILFGVELNPAIWERILGVICVLVGTLIALGGPEVIKWTNRVLTVALLGCGAIVVGVCFLSVPLADILAVKPPMASNSPLVNFMLSAEGNAAFALSWTTQALVLPRLAKTERSGYWGTSLAYGIIAPFFIFAGGVMALAMAARTGVYESDPTAALATLAGPVFSIISLLLVAFANIGTQGVGSYVNSMVIKSGIPNVSYRLLVMLAFVYVSALTVWGGVAEHFGAYISLAAFLQGPIMGMALVDYLIVRKRKLSLKSAYFIEGHDAYRYPGGINPIGIACLVITFVVAYLFVYNPATCTIKSSIFYITTGTGFTLIMGGLLYWLASLTPLKNYMLRDRDDLEIV